jgi:lysyl-tRNA synthetase class 2
MIHDGGVAFIESCKRHGMERQDCRVSDNWQPSASTGVLKQRAQLLKQIRDFMAAREILEVETPVLSHYGNTDANLNSFTTLFHSPSVVEPELLYLQTSPEFAMKRLLAAGSGPIYQIARVFRDAELGRLHQPEFTMLEWYRPGFDHHKLMDEMAELLLELGLTIPARASYATVFTRVTDINPHQADISLLQEAATRNGLQGTDNTRSVLLDFLFSHLVAPELGRTEPVFIYDFPVCQAALARIRADHPPVAERFELFIAGMEIANGFHELTDAKEQMSRFEQDNSLRKAKGLAEVMIDENMIASLAHGLPDCAGVALGIDRLLMAILGYDSINKVVSFTSEHA